MRMRNQETRELEKRFKKRYERSQKRKEKIFSETKIKQGETWKQINTFNALKKTQ